MKFMLNRDKVVTSIKGHTIGFVKDVLTHVPDEMHEEVLAVGAVPENEIIEAPKTGKEAPTDDKEREARIMPVLEDILLRNDRDDFTASGTPKIEIVTAGAGFRVTDKERNALWSKLTKGTTE